jgi:tetratricopeptide (TPR) repeat protein
VISRGYVWFKSVYCAYVLDLEQTSYHKDYSLLCDCYYMIGDVHDFNGSPKAAIKAYHKSFTWDPTCSAALREIGCMYSNMGELQKALSSLKKSLRIYPTDEHAISDYNYVLFQIEQDATGIYEENDVCWQAREKLAQDKPKLALRLLKHKRTMLARQIMANAYAMLDDLDSVLEQWQKIANGQSMIEMRHADWFYLYECVWDSVEFWELLASCAQQKRFDYSIWPMFESLEQVIPHPLRRRRSSADRSRCLRRVYLLTQYHVARLKHDHALANKLTLQYPKWPEIQNLAAKL